MTTAPLGPAVVHTPGTGLERDVLTRALSGVLDNAYAAVSPKPRLSFIAPGATVAWDECCEGQMWVRMTTIRPLVDAKLQRSVDPRCGHVGNEVTIELGLIRCVAVLNDEGQPPSATQMTNDSLKMIEDMQNLQRSLLCGSAEDPNIARLVLGSWTPLGPLGGCAGGTWVATLWLPGCITCT